MFTTWKKLVTVISEKWWLQELQKLKCHCETSQWYTDVTSIVSMLHVLEYWVCCVMDIDTSFPGTQGQASAEDMFMD